MPKRTSEQRTRSAAFLRMILAAGCLLASLGLMSTPASTYAQNAGESTPAPEAAKVETNSEWDVVLDLRYEGLLFADVSVDGSARKFNFLVDSGASTSVFSLHLAERLGLPMMDSPMPAQGVGTQEMKLVSDVSINVDGFDWMPSMFAVIDTNHMGRIGDHRLDGILGCDFLYEFKTCEFDFENLKLRLKKFAPGERKRTIQDMAESMKELTDLVEKIKKVMEGDASFEELIEIATELLKRMLEEGQKQAGGDSKESDDTPENKEPEKPKRYAPSPAGTRVHAMRDVLSALNAAFKAETNDANTETPSPYATKNSFPFRMIDAQIPLVGDIVIGTLMFTDIDVNGTTIPVLFDTGAATALVLDQGKARDLDTGEALSLTVSGVGTSTASLGIARSMTIGSAIDTSHTPAILMGLEELFSALNNPIMQMLGAKNLDAKGIVGLSWCMNYRTMTFDNLGRRISFEPYTSADRPKHMAGSTSSRDLLAGAVKNAWSGTAGDLGFEASSLSEMDKLLEVREGGLIVRSVAADGPANMAGLERGDLITHFEVIDGETVVQEVAAGADELAFYLAYMGSGQRVRLKVERKRSNEAEWVALTTAPLVTSGSAPSWFKK